ncbi:hypothetical protein CEE36_05140 [candidate division TA06 bacterium B3_TA06]|uniref:Uncharacterized protein n=1 Tax=candidate division TA06 bacterium B3_TA06 TaxID=2012487 RepID=A0A532V7G4_UNCT6|nr:MAG: hypothetical protein CEE36_05140 [candidate division TA06 bacterium B3_TA06]
MTLHWSGGDPDPELPYYDVYLGTTDPPPLREVNLIEKYCEISDLDSNTTYYWMIVAQDEQGDTAAGPIWSFTTTMGDSYEPNNLFDQAYGPLSFGTVYESWIWDWEDYYDIYYFIPDSSGIVKIDLYSLPTDYDLVLFDENQEELDWSSKWGPADESISYYVTGSELYYVVVILYDRPDSRDSYLLKVDYIQTQDSYEPNDSFDDAYGPLDFETTYESWISTWDDVDYYYFVPASDGWIGIDLYSLPEDYDLYLCDSNYDLIDASENEYTESEWIEFEGSASETYYVVVVPFEGYDATDSYYLEIYYSYGSAQTWGHTHREKRNLKID